MSEPAVTEPSPPLEQRADVLARIETYKRREIAEAKLRVPQTKLEKRIAKVAPPRDWSPVAVATLGGAAIRLGLPSTTALIVASTMPGGLRDDGMVGLLSLAIVGSLPVLVAFALVGRAWVGPIAWFAGAAYAAASVATIVAKAS